MRTLNRAANDYRAELERVKGVAGRLADALKLAYDLANTADHHGFDADVIEAHKLLDEWMDEQFGEDRDGWAPVEGDREVRARMRAKVERARAEIEAGA